MDPSPQSPILLVDDEPANLLSLEAVLEPLGEPLVRAASGPEALRQLRDRDFAAVLLDVRMPGMGGFEAARLIRAQRRSRATPIIFITADGSDVAITQAYAMGAVDFLTKPIMPAVIKGKVAFFIELHRSKQELQAAERQAVQDRAFLSAVLEAVEDGIVACGPDGRLTLFNRALREFHGIGMRPLTPDQWASAYSLYQADGRTLLEPAEIPLSRALAGEHVHNAEMVIAPPDGKARSVLASGQPLYDERGHKLGAVVSMHDITSVREIESAREAAATEQARRQEAEAAAALIRESEQRLRASEERVRLATDAAGLGVWVWDAHDGKITWENERLFELLGVQRGAQTEDSARFVTEFLHPEDADAFEQSMVFAASLGTRLHFEGRFIRRDTGSLRWMELTGILQPGADGMPRRILGTAADITERKRAEDELRRSEERYRTLFESIDEGFCVIEMMHDESGAPSDYRFLEMNPAFAKHTGLHLVIGKRMRELVPDHDQSWFDIYGRVAASGDAVRFENEAKAMGRWFDVYATRLGGPGSLRVAVLFTDITERKRSEEDLRRLAQELAETDRRKTEFLATLAHELRNPLAPLTNGLQLLKMAATSPQARQRARDMMERQLRHLVHLVDDLLDIARISSGKVELKKERLSLRSVLDGAVETSLPLLTAAAHTLDTALEDDSMQVEADATRLAQVVSNLLNNAAKYTPRGGRIRLSVRRDGGDALIEVADSGVGIAPEALPHVFEMFTQVGRNQDRSPGGLGIGLALVRRLVELHGGSVTAASPGVGQGSVFTVRLPLAQPAQKPASPGMASVPAVPVQGLRVLVVDDNTDAAESLATLLELGGHATRVANSGDEALRTAHEFRPEVVFLDIGMPGKDGYQVARELRQSVDTCHAMLVALTGWGAKDDRARSREAGFDHHLTKPAGLAAVDALLAGMARHTPGADHATAN
ncbi:MAG TPA: response regulator [Ramlibacter sp.]|nr:response regulator [Ramlibacter sp.]